jgi:hypothetical protein
MKKITLLCSTCLLAALAFPAEAQTKTILKGDIPFEFSVGSYAPLPAGFYTIEVKDNFLRVTSATDGKMVGLPLLPTATPGSATPAIEFRKYGDRAFLSAVRAADGNHGIPVSKTERKLAMSVSAATVSVDAGSGDADRAAK